MTDEPLKAVKSADDMDTETFLKHMNARHMPIGGMKAVGRSNIPNDHDENLLRAYHDRIHAKGAGPYDTPINHTHAPSGGEGS